jgi:putative aldouronate transport system substrate-binding protein
MMKRVILTLFLTALLAAGAFAEGQQEGEAGDPEAPVSVMVYERGRVPASQGDVTDNRWVEWIQEQTDVEIEWAPIPRWEVRQSLNTQFAAGSAPDLIHDFPRPTISQFRRQGVLRPVDDMVENFSTSYAQYLEDNPDLLPYVRWEDGQMWAFTSKRPVDSIENHTMWIRTDWLDAVGMDVPETEEEFFEVMDAFVNEDPDGNGEDDTFGAATFISYRPVAEQLYQVYPWYIEDGQATYRIFTERYEGFLNFHQTMYENGYVDPEWLTDAGLQRQTQFWVTGKAGLTFASLDPPNFEQLRANVPDAEVAPIDSFETEWGQFPLLDEPPAHRFVGVNRAIENPQGAMEFLDWMIAEGWYPLTYGLEGEHHEVVQGEIPKQTIDQETWREELWWAFEYALLDQRQVKPDWIPVMAAEDPLSQEQAELRAEALRIGLEGNFRRDFPIEPAADEIGQFFAEFDPIEGGVVNEVIVGEREPAEAVEFLRSEWERLGGDEITQIYQEFYENNSDVVGPDVD